MGVIPVKMKDIDCLTLGGKLQVQNEFTLFHLGIFNAAI